MSEYICPKNKLNVLSSTIANWLRKQHHFIKLINFERKTRLVAFNCKWDSIGIFRIRQSSTNFVNDLNLTSKCGFSVKTLIRHLSKSSLTYDPFISSFDFEAYSAIILSFFNSNSFNWFSQSFCSSVVLGWLNFLLILEISSSICFLLISKFFESITIILSSEN